MGLNYNKMNVPKRLYPHLYEYESFLSEGRELGAQMYISKNERAIILESKKMYLVRHDRERNLGTDKEIHGINEKEK
jgi:hypothetical protein